MSYKISFCIVCMNRLYHLKETLLKNIEDNISYEKLEFILLDYNSTDGIEDWVKLNMKNYIKKGILKYYKTGEPKSFHRSHSRNVAMKLGSGDIICNLDADNFLGKDFAHYINYHFSFSDVIFLCSGKPDGSYGRVSTKKKDFLKIRGYDEKMSGWGFEDDDLYQRLENLGREKQVFYDEKFTQFIDHEIEESFSNDKNVLGIESIYVQYDSYTKSNVLFLLRNKTFYYGKVVKPNEYDALALEGNWKKGTYKVQNREMTLNFKSNLHLSFKVNDTKLSINKENEFIKADEKLEKYLKIEFTSLENKKNYEAKGKEIVSNPKDWGKATLIKNFSKKIRI
jgi:hypothetical protein